MPEEEPKQPYVGLRPFERGDESLFFGRDHEAVQLASLILAHPAVLLYAPSGSGKTSLLQARVIPLLEERAVEVLGPARVGGETHQEGPREAVRNVFLFNALMSIQPETAMAGALSGKTLAEYLSERPHPQAPATDLPPLRLLLFDQFEEIFTSHPDHWPSRGDFFEEIGAALESDPNLRAAFAMREEYIASLDPHLGRLPERLRTRYRLEPLREQPALDAITRPVDQFDRSFAAGAAEDLLERLLHRTVKTLDGMAVPSAEFVDPLQLQVVCRQLWRKLPPEATTIDRNHIKRYADVDQALEEFYDERLAEVVRKTDCEEGSIRKWFDKLITTENTRNLLRQGRTDTEGLANEIVAELERHHLVHAVQRAGQCWYELNHDRLIDPIRASNQKWQRTATLSDSDVQELISSLAFYRSDARKLRGLLQSYDLPTRGLHRIARDRHVSIDTQAEADEDWSHAELVFALEVLEGQVQLHRLGPRSFQRLERQWLSDVKRTKAYLLWEEHEDSTAPDNYYLDACDHLRRGLTDERLKTTAQSFATFEDYLRTRYLDAKGKFDAGKDDAMALLRTKASRIHAVTGVTDQVTNSNHALEYTRMYYDNILAAVRTQDQESTLAILEAFQFSRAPEHRYLIINCFEAAIAIYFLSAQVVREIWAHEEGRPIPGF